MTGTPVRPDSRRVLAAVLVMAAFGGLGYVGWSVATAESPEARAAAARNLAAGIDVSVGVDHSSLAATLAIADFGIEERVRLVPVRILEQIGLELRIRAASDVILAGPPRVCLVGPHWAPDDAGLSDRCWGDPDLGALVGSQLASDADGHPRLDEDVPIEVIATIARGHERCDYPVGTWSLEVAVEPIVDGRPEGSFQLPDTQFDVSLEPAGTALRLVARGDSRYCGLAQSVWREQGEPSLIAP